MVRVTQVLEAHVLGDGDWLGFTVEAYVYAAVVYFVMCFAMSRYSQRLEAYLEPERS